MGANVRGAGGRAGGLCLSGLLFLLPFEPRRPLLILGGLQVTVLEAAAALAGAALLWSARERLVTVLRRPPLPLVFLLLYAAAHAASAVLAPAHRDLALKFSLRMAAMAAVGLLVAATPREQHGRALAALVASTCVVALLAILEGVGARWLDGFLAFFREMPFNVGGSRRATAGSEYPNLAAAFLMCGLLAGAGLSLRLAKPMAATLAVSALVSWGMLYTYSRGALVATGFCLAALAAVAGRTGGRMAARVPLAALAVVLASSSAFAAKGEVFRLRLGTEGTRSWYGAVYEPAEASLELAPGETRATVVRVTNSGLKTWSEKEAFHLSYHWYDRDRRYVTDGGRTSLPRDLATGETVLLNAQVQAPPHEGRFLLVWDMVHEQTAWFSGQGVAPAAVPVRVARAGAGAAATSLLPEAVPQGPLAWRPQRGELWRVALDMWKGRPWTGVGSDNFRWLHGPMSGHPFWDSRVFANNALLEAAATTGTFGLVALVGTLASAGVSSVRAALAAAPGTVEGARAAALFAVLAGIACHGVVDYVLAFTGHYLLFGFVVGAISAPSWAGSRT